MDDGRCHLRAVHFERARAFERVYPCDDIDLSHGCGGGPPCVASRLSASGIYIETGSLCRERCWRGSAHDFWRSLKFLAPFLART
jgi:hypothetical protein